MPATPTSNGQTYSNVGATGVTHLDDLIGNTKWGQGVGTGIELTFSFPSGSAVWASNYSQDFEPATWSSLDSNTAALARDAIQAWSNVASINFVEVTETPSLVGDLRFAYSGAVDSSGFAGWAYYPGSTPAAGDVWLAHDLTNPYNVVLHELGHALGLSHPGDSGGNPAYSDQYTIMSYNSHPHALYREVTQTDSGYSWRYWEVQADTPMLYDIAAVQYLHGANMSYHSGNDIYTFDPDTPFFRTIWDGGGTDTISVANFTKGSVIDLRAGEFSSLTIESDPLPPGASSSTVPTYYGQDNLAIAFNVVIENATGGSGHDHLIGNDADNVLTGNAGNDTLEGGLGNDIYVVDAVGDVVTEAPNAGIDTVQSSVTRSLGANQETLVLTGNSAILGTGNSLDNTITGNSAANVLTGGDGNDKLVGKAGKDTLDGGIGNDTLNGGLGNDTYIVDSTGDILKESPDAGVDTVQSSVTRSLGGNQDNLILTGTSAINGTGNNLGNLLTGNGAANTLTGNAGNDTLDGGADNDLLKGGLGNDTLIGGDGADFFIFNTNLDAVGNIDVLIDFVSGTDKIRLDDDIFLAFDATVSGTLTTIQLYMATGATAAQDAFDRIIYNTSTGALYYDEDGLGGVSSIQFALLGTSAHPGLATDDFRVID